jgi:hypothetical protein
VQAALERRHCRIDPLVRAHDAYPKTLKAAGAAFA